MKKIFIRLLKKSSKTFLLLLFIVPVIVKGQNLQNANWCFGIHAKASFGTSGVTTGTSQISESNAGTSENSASVSDENGQLLFYTDGINVWSRNDQMMPNGRGLYGNGIGSNEHVLIVPKPGSKYLYYIFSIAVQPAYSSVMAVHGRGGIHYTVIDMTPDVNNGYGDVAPGLKNIPLKDHNGTPLDYALDNLNPPSLPYFLYNSTRMTTTLSADKTSIWLTIMPDYYYNSAFTRYFYNYSITTDGIGNQPDGTSPAPTVNTLLSNTFYNYNTTVATIKVSPDGKTLCDAGIQVNMYDYDNATGNISNGRMIFDSWVNGNGFTGYGAEFSPDSKILYFTQNPAGITQDGLNGMEPQRYANIYQYNIRGSRLGTATPQIIYQYTVPNNAGTSTTTLPYGYPFEMQLGPDNKIYVCAFGEVYQYSNYLGVINSPNTLGTGCNFNPAGVLLATGTTQNGTLPQWVWKAVPMWPKVYERGTKILGNLVKGTSGNIFFSPYSTNILNNINHNGPLTSSPNSYFLIQYNGNGVTNWLKPSTYGLTIFALKSGDIRLRNINTSQNFSYYNGTTGTQINPLSFIPDNEDIVAETNSGAYITSNDMFTNVDADYRIYVHTPTTTSSIFCRGGEETFNVNTNKLFESTVRSGNRYFEVYQLINDNLILQSSIQQYPNYYNVVHVDNQDHAYTIQNGQLYQFDYVNNSISLLSVPGLNNNNLVFCPTSNPYTDDKLMVYNSLDQKLYIIDFAANQAKGITTVNYQTCNYVIDGNDVYISGGLNDQTNLTVGSQIISPVPTTYSYSSNYITRLNIQNDFNFRNPNGPLIVSNKTKPVFKVSLSPNPTNKYLKIVVKENSKTNIQPYLVAIEDSRGITVLKKDNYFQGSDLNIQSLPIGTYYIEVINNKGEKAGKSFLKL